MKIRRFRAYAEKDDLQNVLEEFQDKFEIYYVPTYSDTGKISYNSIMEIENAGVNFYGSHIGNMQMFVFLKNTECLWRTETGNSACICIDLNGIYQENAIFPTEISTMYYDNETAKRLYDGLKKIFRKQAVKSVNGAYICPKAYEHKGNYRFCTIDIKSPPEYDLKVE
ncbi:MAG: hypothetical protein J6K58_11385 [Lachnospiraceae bacterium]|nr:hypothetical protein [Lachnospiraceae bacterium]